MVHDRGVLDLMPRFDKVSISEKILGKFVKIKNMEGEKSSKITVDEFLLMSVKGDDDQNLIENGAKCVEYSEIRSMYVWGVELQSEKEWRVEVKSSESKKVEITEFLEKNHPYEIPQILVKAVGSTETYSRWIHSQEEPSK